MLLRLAFDHHDRGLNNHHSQGYEQSDGVENQEDYERGLWRYVGFSQGQPRGDVVRIISVLPRDSEDGSKGHCGYQHCHNRVRVDRVAFRYALDASSAFMDEGSDLMSSSTSPRFWPLIAFTTCKCPFLAAECKAVLPLLLAMAAKLLSRSNR
nr:hypothetical protein DVH24_019739 [Ipomoea batatas]